MSTIGIDAVHISGDPSAIRLSVGRLNLEALVFGVYYGATGVISDYIIAAIKLDSVDRQPDPGR